MVRWSLPNARQTASPAIRWQSRAEILKKHQVRPDYYWLRFGHDAWQREQAHKYDPDQPRVPAGNPDGGQWMNAAGGQRPDIDGGVNVAARISRQRELECEAQYKLDSAICRIVRTPLCWEQAMKRRAACISGYQLPPLNF
jgi:hypothetical protein